MNALHSQTGTRVRMRQPGRTARGSHYRGASCRVRSLERAEPCPGASTLLRRPSLAGKPDKTAGRLLVPLTRGRAASAGSHRLPDS